MLLPRLKHKYHLLQQHKELCITEPKEAHFFDALMDPWPETDGSEYSIDWYNSLCSVCSPKAQCGDATPTYMFLDKAIKRVAQLQPQMQWILILRDPVSRAYSEYQMNVATRPTDSEFEQWLFGDNMTFEEALELEKPKNPHQLGTRWSAHQYLQRGEYMNQIEQILTRFNRSQLLVLISEEVRTSRNYTPIYKFLNVSDVPGDMPDSNVLAYEPMRTATRDRLREHFRPHNERLFAWLGRRVPAWEAG